MHVIRSFVLVIAVTSSALYAVSPSQSAETTAPATPPRAAPDAMARGIIVKTTTASPREALVDAVDEALAPGVDVEAPRPLSGRISTIDFSETTSETQASEVAREVAERSDVVWAVPNVREQATSNPPVVSRNDEKFPQQRNLWDSRTSAERGLAPFPVGGYSMRAPVLWQRTQGDPDIVVAVLDSGIVTHPDLAGQTVPGYDMITRDAVGNYFTANDGDGRDPDPSDPGDWYYRDECVAGAPHTLVASTWHGTHVAGIIAAKSDNNVAIAGVAPGVKVQPVRVLGTCGGYADDIIAGIIWASGGDVEASSDGDPALPPNPTPARVLNLSLGGLRSTAAVAQQLCVAYNDVIAAARARGSFVVVSAGNDNADAARVTPGSCAGVFTVGATGDSGARAVYSNSGSVVDISAQGGDGYVDGGTAIWSTVDAGIQTPVGASTAMYQGTSMAAPAVAASAALLLSLADFTPPQLESALRAMVQPFPSRAGFGSYPVDGSPRDLNCTTARCGSGILDLSRVPRLVSPPVVTGNKAVGQTLSASTGSWTGSPTSFSYAWLRNGTPIAGATGPRYQARALDRGASLSVRVFPSAFRPFATLTSSTAPIGAQPSSVTSARWSGTKLRFGTSVVATVTVSASGDRPSGPLEIREGTKVVARGTAVNGSATIAVGGTSLAAGAHSLRAVYLGSTASTSSSAPVKVTVVKAASKVTLTAPKKVKKSTRATVTIKVAVAGVARPTGSVKIYDGAKRLKTVKLTAGGIVTVKLARFSKKGTHKLKAVYGGTANVTGKTSKVVKVKVS